MSSGSAPVSHPRHDDRVLGRYTKGVAGPTVVVCGGVHGNEPSGVEAARRVMARLQELELPLRGTVVAVAGNLEALAHGKRFMAFDLNRCWTSDRIDALQNGGLPASPLRPEDAEQQELFRVIREADRQSADGLLFLDLHSTSGKSPPFTLMSDTLRNRGPAFALPGPVVLGLEESVDGTLLEFLTRRGHRALVVESGQHDEPGSIDRHEAIIWVSLAAAGSLRKSEIPDFARHRRLLDDAARGLPRVVEVRYRKHLEPDDEFRMHEGFQGFDAVSKGDVLAKDRKGDVAAPESGRLLMPLYQVQGNDGFFIVRKVGRFWLGLSRALRTLRLHVLLPLLPGVSRHADHPGSLVVNRKVARWFVVQIFHLFGYRHRRHDGKRWVFSRRRDQVRRSKRN